jgi:Holliday junction resolvase RusA-like endonuclease
VTPFVSIEVRGCVPAPWSTPTVGNRTSRSGKRYRFTTRDRSLTFWQQYVRVHARQAMAGRRPTTAPLFVQATFHFRGDEGAAGNFAVPAVTYNYSKGIHVKSGSLPDVDNLTKAAMDALQEIVFGNDAQVCQVLASRRYGTFDGATIRIFEIDGATTA